jgi:hypothetical protein
MERLRALLAEAQRYYTQLSQREKLLLLAMVGVFVLLVGTVVVTSVSHRISLHEMAIEEKTGDLQKVAVYAQSYAEAERKRKDLELKLGGPPVKLMSQLQGMAERDGLTITSMNDRGDQALHAVKESLVEMQIASASIDKLGALLNDIEHDPKIIKVRKLRLRPNSTDAKSLNAVLTIGTYQLLTENDKKLDKQLEK